MIASAGAGAKAAVALLAMMAAQGTLLAAIGLVLARHRRPNWQAAVWLVVIVKLALPWGPAMPYSLSDVIELLRGTSSPAAAHLTATQLASAVPAPSAPVGPAIAWILLGIAWAAGSAFVLARTAIAMRRASQRARSGQPAPASVVRVLAQLAELAGVRAPRLVLGSDRVGPHVVGILRPIIVVPPALVDDPDLLRAALLHELAHVRRKDALARLVQAWVVALFFFFPVVRAVTRRLDLAREAACDAWALEAGQLSRPAYARLLVQMAQLRTAAAAASFAMPRSLDVRVAAVLGPPTRARLGLVHRIALAGWVVLALGGARSVHARTARETCSFSPKLAEALRLVHPEADLDGDGVLSRDEACRLQADLRKHVDDGDLVSVMADPAAEDVLQSFLDEPLCCTLPAAEPEPAASCSAAEGVSR